MQLAIAMPAFNEVDTLRAVARDALAEITALAIDGIVYVVDDGSTDGTGALADQLATEDPRVVVTHHDRNLGFGGAIRSALTGTCAEFVFLVPADGQVPLAALGDFWRIRDGVDVVTGVRHPRVDTWSRRILSWGYHWMSRVLLGVPLAEFSSALLFRRAALEIPMLSEPRSAALLSEIMCRLQMRGSRFAVVRYPHRPRAGGVSKAGRVSLVVRTFLDLLRVAWLVRLRERLTPRA